MADGALIFRATTGRDAGRIVRVGVRQCPDPSVARAAIEQVFQEVEPNASVRWENGGGLHGQRR